jgi:Tfp pilus assembly protein PilN
MEDINLLPWRTIAHEKKAKQFHFFLFIILLVLFFLIFTLQFWLKKATTQQLIQNREIQQKIDTLRKMSNFGNKNLKKKQMSILLAEIMAKSNEIKLTIFILRSLSTFLPAQSHLVDINKDGNIIGVQGYSTSSYSLSNFLHQIKNLKSNKFRIQTIEKTKNDKYKFKFTWEL